MIKAKAKICSVCGKEAILWRSNPKTCKTCAGKQSVLKLQKNSVKEAKVYTPISKQSDKRKKLDAIYNIAAAIFKKAKPNCMAKLPGCMVKTSDVHHLRSGKDKLKYYLDQSTWITVCVSCHFKIHNEMGKDELIKLGLKKIE